MIKKYFQYLDENAKQQNDKVVLLNLAPIAILVGTILSLVWSIYVV